MEKTHKNIVICCDGTSNQYNDARTNVVGLYYALIDDPARQMTFYHPGLGTMGPPGALTKFDRFWTSLLGLAFGWGIEEDICNAYVFLMNNYEDGDKVFIFGFSRGAYTARCLAAVLYCYGLLHKDNQRLVAYAVRMIVELGAADSAKWGDLLKLAAGFKDTFSRTCKIAFVGVWDTVSSVGWFTNPMSLPNTADNPDIAVGRQAISIDEHRAFFRQNVWRHSPAMAEHGPLDVKQVWFPGVHSDVGGGYPFAESGQSQFALEWMLVEARNYGLLLDPARVDWIMGKAPRSPYLQPTVDQRLHESLKGLGWWLAEFVPKKHFDAKTKKTGLRANLFRRRTMPPAPHVHESAYLRGPEYAKFIPVDAVKEPRVPI